MRQFWQWVFSYIVKYVQCIDDKCLEYINFLYKFDIYHALIDHIL